MNLRTSSFFILVIALVVLAGCSGSSAVNPVNPLPESIQAKNLPVGVTESFPDGTPSSGFGALGLFSLSLNHDNVSAQLSPLRKSSLTDVLEVVDITNFLQMTPCTDCAKINSVSLNSDNHLVVSIGIRHPFPAGDPFKPPSGRNRADLHVFNVEGTVVSNLASISYPGLGTRIAGFKLLNADGYSPYLDGVLDDIFPTDATVHPYITHFDDYSAGNFDPLTPTGFTSVTNPPPSGNLVMAMGCDYNDQDYVFDITGSTEFIYAIGCTYAVSSANKAQRFNPEYRVPQHNKKAASEVSVEIISNDLTALDTNSSAAVEIHVVDINHGVAVGTGLDEMFADSSVGGIQIEIPGVETSILNVDITSPTGGGHDPADPLVYSATITNTAGADLGTFSGLVKVTDSYSPGLNQSPLLNGNDGIKRVDPIANPLTGTFSIDEFATYATFDIEIAGVPNEPPVADLLPVDTIVALGGTILWDATASADPDGTITQYEWDYDILNGDPVNFSADIVTTTPTSTQLSAPYNTEGSFFAAVRVTDNLGATDIAVAGFSVNAFVPTYWNQFSHNPTHNARTNLTGPQTNNVEWILPGPGFNALNVMEGYDGTIYWGTVFNSGQIHAANSDGTMKWVYNPTIAGSWNKPLGVTPDDTVVYSGLSTAAFEGRITGIDTDTGAELWITPYMYSVSANTYGLILEDGDLVVSGEGPAQYEYNTLRIDKNGNEVWRTPTDWNWCTAPAQGPDGTIYCKSGGAKILGLNPDTGAEEHSIDVNVAGLNTQGCLAVRSDGSIVFQGNIGLVPRTWCFDADLNLLWTLDAGDQIPIDGFGIGLNDEIYFTTYGYLEAISPDGTHLEWTYPGAMHWTTPCVDADGTIYVGMITGMAAVNPDGTTKWTYSAPSYGCPMIAHDGSLYANIEGDLYKFKDL